MMPGTTFGEIQDAILAAFDRGDLEKTLRRQMNLRLEVIVSDENLDEQIFELLEWAEMNGREVELMRVLSAERPSHPAMREIGRKYGMAIPVTIAQGGAVVAEVLADTAGGGVEKIVRPHLSFSDLALWREKMAAVERRVAMIGFAGVPQGTGFLVGEDLLLTNWHVMRPLLLGQRSPAQVECLFDYKRLPDGSTTRTPVGLHPEAWNVDSCPCSPLELEGRAGETLPTLDELDYALVRLAEKAGGRPWAPGATAADAPLRGWISLPDPPGDLQNPMGVVIAQHPAGWPLKLAIDTAGIDRAAGFWLNENGTRIRYATNTLGGSSGSPVFDLEWNLIALHHYGDPGFGHPPSFNQGVPIGRIHERLRSVLGETSELRRFDA